MGGWGKPGAGTGVWEVPEMIPARHPAFSGPWPFLSFPFLGLGASSGPFVGFWASSQPFRASELLLDLFTFSGPRAGPFFLGLGTSSLPSLFWAVSRASWTFCGVLQAFSSASEPFLGPLGFWTSSHLFWANLF